MARGRAGPWAEMLATGSPGALASSYVSSGSLLWHSSTCRSLAITRPASPRLGPSARPQGSRGKRMQERESCLQGGFAPSPRAARWTRLVSGAGLLSLQLHPRERRGEDPPSLRLADSLLGSETASILGLVL